MQNMMHSHYFEGTTSIDDGHQHQYSGVSSSDPDITGHIHFMEGDTTMNDGHSHHYRIQTGPAIYVPGGHYHYYQGETYIADMHAHMMNGYTSMHTEMYGFTSKFHK
ncbi:MAG: YmaF family protein [Bacillota bacterium]